MIVTGGGGVIGAQLAVRLVELAARVGLVGRTRSALEETVARCDWPGQAFAAEADVASREALGAAVDELVSRAGPPTGLVNMAALISATRTIEDVSEQEIGPRGIRVNCVSPGQTPTQLRLWNAGDSCAGDPRGAPRGDPSKLPLRRRGEADDYVGPVLFLLSDLSAYVTGVDLPVDGGLLAKL